MGTKMTIQQPEKDPKWFTVSEEIMKDSSRRYALTPAVGRRDSFGRPSPRPDATRKKNGTHPYVGAPALTKNEVGSLIKYDGKLCADAPHYFANAPRRARRHLTVVPPPKRFSIWPARNGAPRNAPLVADVGGCHRWPAPAPRRPCRSAR